MEKYDVKVDKFNDHTQIYVLTNGSRQPFAKIDLRFRKHTSKKWTINWSAYENQDIELVGAFVEVAKKAIEITKELNSKL